MDYIFKSNPGQEFILICRLPKVPQAPMKDMGGDRQSEKELECNKPPRQGGS
jgi:hypothetical protein